MIKPFKEFLAENYLDTKVDPELVKNEKDLLKNGFIEVEVEVPTKGVKKGDIVLVDALEFGELNDDSLVSCKKDEDEIFIPKKNLKIQK